MNKLNSRLVRNTLALALFSSAPALYANTELDNLKMQIDNLQQQLDALNINDLEKQVSAASEWKTQNALIHMAGYAGVGYMKTSGEDGAFKIASFSPIFHFQYRDLIMLESELEFGITPEGETEAALEYLTADLFLNDYVTLVTGKFLSPIGQFRQNTHPSWINKLPSAPPGFGHDGAAPVSDIGVQLRGGVPIGGMRSNYAVFVTNGPELNADWDGSAFELDGVNAEAKNRNIGGDMVFGGRFGLIPMSGLELGLSLASGSATVTLVEDDSGTAPALGDEAGRNYDVLGFDFNWQYNQLNVRGEYVKSTVGAATTGVSASEGENWKTWFTQASYRFSPSKFEGVVRYTNYDSPNPQIDQKQWALGLNYLMASNVIAKIAYESNDGANGSSADANRILLQLAYGF